MNERSMNSRVLKFLPRRGTEGNGLFLFLLIKKIKGSLAIVSNPLVKVKTIRLVIDVYTSVSIFIGSFLDSTLYYFLLCQIQQGNNEERRSERDG